VLTLLLPQTSEAHGRAQLQRFCLLAAGDVKGLTKTGFGVVLVRDDLPSQ
jgi:hypothetical protein